MLPTAAFQRLPSRTSVHDDSGLPHTVLYDSSNLRHGNSGNAARYRSVRTSSEEQFVVFAPMQSLVERSAGVNRYCFRIDLRGDPGLLAEVIEVSGQAIAQVDARGRGFSATQP